MMNEKQEAVIRLLSGQRKYGHVIGLHDSETIHFISFMNEQIFGAENALNYMEEIPIEQVKEIDFCMK